MIYNDFFISSNNEFHSLPNNVSPIERQGFVKIVFSLGSVPITHYVEFN